MGKENRLYSISLGVASLQGGLVGVATALSPATCRPFQVFSPSFFVGLELTTGILCFAGGLLLKRASHLKRCHRCSEKVERNATRCHRCGIDIPSSAVDSVSQPFYKK